MRRFLAFFRSVGPLPPMVAAGTLGADIFAHHAHLG
jgi:hypothetical protein